MSNREMLTINFENGEVIRALEDTKIIDVIDKLQNKPKDLLGVLVNNEEHSVYYKLVRDSYCNFVTFDMPEGERIYTRSLKFILFMAIQKVCPQLKIHFLNKINRNHFAVVDEGEISKEIINDIKKEMKKIIQADYKFDKIKANFDKAKRIYEKSNQTDKLENMFHKFRGTYTIYSCNGYYNYFYGMLATSTKSIKGFNLKMYKGCLVLMLPKKDNISSVENKIKPSKLHDVFIETNQYHARAGCDTLSKITAKIRDGKIAEVIQFSEALQDRKLVEVAQAIAKRKNVKVVLIAGPSSSGKTTFSRKLAKQLEVDGYIPVPISMDDFFKERNEIPFINGKQNFENVDAVDIELYKKTLDELLAGKEVTMPRFDFTQGKKVFDRPTMKLDKNTVLIIEGIHGLNPLASDFIDHDEKFKIYIAPLVTLSLDNWNKFSSSDARKLRRVVRDAYTRGFNAKRTFNMWKDVVEGEKNNIFPYVDDADFIYNSSLIYELVALAPLAKTLMLFEQNNECSAEAWRLTKILENFLPMDNSVIPNDSILREFIGGSSIKI
ncbi:MAG: nucleoside kinase [Clostridia bacterium]